ncbi:MAG: porin [Paenibacillus sp.]|nr:porin [Paenibacillus sp.]
MRAITLTAISALFMTMTCFATASAQDEEPKLTIKPTGRILLDGAIYCPDGDGFADGVALPDIRMGAKVGYGNWAAKIDVGYGFGKLSMKDVYIQYNFNENNLLRAGYFVHQFGLNAATSSSMKPAMEAPISDTFFNATGRNIGVMYVYDKEKFFVGVSGIVAGTSMTTPANEQAKVSVGALNRMVYRPYFSDGLVAQVGASLWYQSAMHKKIENEDGEAVASPGYFDFSAGFPTRVCKVNLLGADIQEAKGVFKFSPELLLAKNRVALESQYYYMNVSRKGDYKTYTAQGVYGLLRGLLIGDSYGYSHGDAGLATPKPGSLEMILGYNYMNANSRKAEVFGGISNDYSLTLNYYINKYMLARLRYSYTDVRHSAVQKDRHVSTIQARIQIIF